MPCLLSWQSAPRPSRAFVPGAEVCLSVCLSVCLFVCLSIYPSIYLSIYLSICMSMYTICISLTYYKVSITRGWVPLTRWVPLTLTTRLAYRGCGSSALAGQAAGHARLAVLRCSSERKRESRRCQRLRFVTRC